MTTGQLVFFAGWLVLAMLAGVLIYVVWERLHAKFAAGDAPAQTAPTGGEAGR